MTLFADTSALYAAADRSDSSHAAAARALGSDQPVLITDHVLVESWFLIRSRGGAGAADGFWAGVRESGIRIESVGAADLEVAWRIAEAWPDQSFSIVDRTSFAVLERLGVHRVATFDDDFAIYRYGAGRRRAFEIVR